AHLTLVKCQFRADRFDICDSLQHPGTCNECTQTIQIVWRTTPTTAALEALSFIRDWVVKRQIKLIGFIFVDGRELPGKPDLKRWRDSESVSASLKEQHVAVLLQRRTLGTLFFVKQDHRIQRLTQAQAINGSAQASAKHGL